MGFFFLPEAFLLDCMLLFSEEFFCQETSMRADFQLIFLKAEGAKPDFCISFGWELNKLNWKSPLLGSRHVLDIDPGAFNRDRVLFLRFRFNFVNDSLRINIHPT
jgi:hypothetical protein